MSRPRPADLLGRLLPAVPVPMTAAGAVHPRGQAALIDHLAAAPIGGVAVWAHTGRGLRIGRDARLRVLRDWRRGVGDGRLLVAAAGPTGTTPTTESAVEMAREAADLGADALLVHPPRHLVGLPDADRQFVDYHHAVAGAGLPLILFWLYEAAGGVSYSPAVLRELLGRDDVLGIKVATLDSVMTFQDLAAGLAADAPGKALVTGEDRFLGYSALAGGRSALIGMGTVCPGLQARMLRAAWEGDGPAFFRLNPAVDDLARHTFRAPMEGYILRLLWCLALQGVIPAEAAHDPWGPPLDPAERLGLLDCLGRIGGADPGGGP